MRRMMELLGLANSSDFLLAVVRDVILCKTQLLFFSYILVKSPLCTTLTS